MVAEEIKAFKELLDAGAITQDEYEYKKRELLNMPYQPGTDGAQPNRTALSRAGGSAYPSYQADELDDEDRQPEEKSKVAAGLLAIFLGSLGLHKFYLGYAAEGVAMLLITLLGSLVLIGPVVMAIVSLIEGIIYLTKSNADFYATYVQNQKVWF